MLRRLFLFLLVFGALAGPGYCKDELILGISQAPGAMNPLNSSTMAQSLIQNMTGRPFTAYDSHWKIVCLLCTEVPSLEAGTARVVELPDGRKGMEIDAEMKPMRWGDGKPVTTRDVAFTIEVGKHPLSGVASAEGYRRIVKLDIKDDHRFTYTIDRVTFHYNNIGLRLLPAHIERPIFEANPAEYRNRSAYEADPTNPGLAYGPYRIVEFVPNSRVVLERNAAWTGQKPYFKRLVVKVIENTTALQANLRSGSVDYALGELGLSLDQALAFEKRRDGNYNIIYKPSLTYEHVDMNLDNALLKDRRIRRALLESIDRVAISEKLFEGRQPVADSCVSPLDPMFSPAARQYRYDPDSARKLLAEAGFADVKDGVRTNAQGERLSFEMATTAGNRMREQLAQVIQSQLRNIGIELRLKAAPPRTFYETLDRRSFSGMAMYAWIERPEGVPRRALHSTQIPTAANGWLGFNYPAYRNPTMDRALEAAESELDPGKRRALFADIQRIYAEDLPALPLFFRVDPFVIPKALKGVTPTGHLNSSTLWVEYWRWEE